MCLLVSGQCMKFYGQTEAAYHYVSRHLEIAKETGDRMGQATVQVSQLAKTLEYTGVIQMTPDVKSFGRTQENGGVDPAQLSPNQGNKSDLLDDQEDFSNLTSR